ncbi:MAG: hypothetical protein K2N46_10905 [Lachnospiraceae bacterium]|nr:hypothetical protein [Lachnospiraceae bacterium]
MKESKIEKQQRKLLELGVMEKGDTLIDFFQASYVEHLIGKFGSWKQGWAYFTEKRLIVFTGLLEENLIIPYDRIRGLGKCSQSLLPIGIEITYEHPETGKTVSSKVSMMKRDRWLKYLSEKSGVSVS